MTQKQSVARNAPFKFRHTSEIAGSFVVLALLLLLAGVFLAAHYQGWFEGKFELQTRFTTDEGSFGLQEGGEVRIRNTVAGKVGKIMPTADGGMQTTFIVQERFRPFVRRDSIAKVKMKFGVAGDAFVEIGMGKGKMAAAGDFIECNKDEEIMETAKKALNDVREVVLPMLEEVQGILKHVNGIAGKIEHGDGVAGAIINDRDMSANLKQGVENLNGALSEARQTLHEATRLAKGAQKHWLVRKHITPEKEFDMPPPWQFLSPAEVAACKEHYVGALEKARTANDSRGIVENACGLATCLLSEEEYDEARMLLDEAKAECGAASDAAVRAAILECDIDRLMGEFDAAVKASQSVAPLLDKTVSVNLKAQCSLATVMAYCDAGKSVEASAELKKAQGLVKKSSEEVKAMAADLAARILLAQGHADQASKEFDREAEILRGIALFHGMAKTLVSAGEACEKADNHAAAADRFFRASRSFFYANDMHRAMNALKCASSAAQEINDQALQMRIELLRELMDKKQEESPSGAGALRGTSIEHART